MGEKKEVTLIVQRERQKKLVIEEYNMGRAGLDTDGNPYVMEYHADGRFRKTRRATKTEIEAYRDNPDKARVSFGPKSTTEVRPAIARTYHPVMSGALSVPAPSGRRTQPALFN